MVVADPRQVVLSRLDVLRAADVLDTSVVLLLQKHYQVSLKVCISRYLYLPYAELRPYLLTLDLVGRRGAPTL